MIIGLTHIKFQRHKALGAFSLSYKKVNDLVGYKDIIRDLSPKYKSLECIGHHFKN